MVLFVPEWNGPTEKAQDTAQQKGTCYIWSEQKHTSIFYTRIEETCIGRRAFYARLKFRQVFCNAFFE